MVALMAGRRQIGRMRKAINALASFLGPGPITLTSTDSLIKTDTVDGTDNKGIAITGGGDLAYDYTRGAMLQLLGNEYSGFEGDAYFLSGAPGSIIVGTPGVTYGNPDAKLFLNGTSEVQIYTATADPSHPGKVGLYAYGSTVKKGADIILYGDNHASAAGQLVIAPGTVAGSHINLNGVVRLPVRAAPAAPVDGDMWRQDNTNTGLKIRIGGVTKTISVV